MKKFVVVLFLSLLCAVNISAQNTNSSVTTQSSAAVEKKKRPPIFRATKDQVREAQRSLKSIETGKLSDADRDLVKAFQASNGLKQTGTLNRATLEKMNIALTDKQKALPVNPNSYASADDKVAKEKKPRKPVFRASKDQIVLAQRMLKEKGFYSGDETGKLDPETRDGIKKFQESVKMKETGTLNRVTLEAMKIELTDKQKEI